MKKVILSLALAVGISATASAQARIGLKAGGSLTTLGGADAKGVSNKFGFHGGLVANLALGDVLSLQPEVLYSMKGAADSDNSKYKINLNYIDIPVMFQYNADGLFFEAGPQLGILASAKSTDGTNDVDIKESLNTIDFGYAVGLGYKLESGPMIGLRYNGGITSIDKEESGTTAAKVRNNAFQLYVGYMFGGK
ncbi:porin family protein [Hymenobacter properus]|uniref:PorT family protein n=1 Tax=Hymenobacter properus TaxID=2791026 RepID=A0A931FLU4_9BACT|nr:porin family protein [Hymenobacter properus]MBF9142396.1 PorT family protein [Hymenobacter properus]MBR7721203.1 PorT family protein [Microvirga sp. SRT04]